MMSGRDKHPQSRASRNPDIRGKMPDSAAGGFSDVAKTLRGGSQCQPPQFEESYDGRLKRSL
jgi:hypothetical protein